MKLVGITGGLGFIGTNLIPELQEQLGVEVRVLDNGTNPSGDMDVNSIELIEGDIRNSDDVKRFIKGLDAVVHLAAHTRVIDSIDDPVFNFESNVIGTFNIMEEIRTQNVPRFVNASTGGAILGEVPPPITEDIAAKPSSPYGASKLSVEGYCWAYSQSYGLAASSLRFSNIYGPHSKNKSSVVAAFIKDIAEKQSVTVYGDGEQTRDYLYVKDQVQGIINAIKMEANGVYQLGFGEPTTINTLIQILREAIGLDFDVTYLDHRDGEILHTHCDISKAREGIDFNPAVGLVEGVALTLEWFRKEGLIQ